MLHRDSLAVRAEPSRPIARHVQGDRVPLDVPHRQNTDVVMRGREVAAVGAEAEDEDLMVAPDREVVDFLVVGDATDLDRAIAKPQRRSGSWSSRRPWRRLRRTW